MDLDQILSEKTFTFIVGEERRIFNIHIAAFACISELLHFMMTNGQMTEAIKREALLEDIDPKIFTLLAKFAYNGIIGLLHATWDFPDWPTDFNCLSCGLPMDDTATSGFFPFCTRQHSRQYNEFIGKGYNAVIHCVYFECRNSWVASSKGPMLCNSHNGIAVRHEFKHLAQYSKPFIENYGFATRRYNTAELSHYLLASFFDTCSEYSTARYDLSTYAQLYVLADRYMVRDLPAICLHRAHALLLLTKFDDDTVSQIVQVIVYTYAHTSREKTAQNRPSDPLRDLIMSFAAEDGKPLMEYTAFKEMLANNEDLASELFQLSYKLFHSPSDSSKAVETLDDLTWKDRWPSSLGS